jgi:hypothetical protein
MENFEKPREHFIDSRVGSPGASKLCDRLRVNSIPLVQPHHGGYGDLGGGGDGPPQRHVLAPVARHLRRHVAVHVACVSKLWKPAFHFVGARVETRKQILEPGFHFTGSRVGNQAVSSAMGGQVKWMQLVQPRRQHRLPLRQVVRALQVHAVHVEAVLARRGVAAHKSTQFEKANFENQDITLQGSRVELPNIDIDSSV